MSVQMNNPPFDLEKALAGQLVVCTKTNQKCWVIAQSKIDNVSYIVEYESGLVEAEKIDYLNQAFVMWQEPHLRIQLNLPKPISKVSEFDSLDTVFLVCIEGYDVSTADIDKLDNKNIYFRSIDDFYEWLEAMRGRK